MASSTRSSFPLWQRFDAALARRAWAPTAEGLVWGLLSLLIMVQGWLRGFNLVTFIATFLLAMWVLNAATTLFHAKRLKRLRVERRLAGLIHAGSPASLSLQITNAGQKTVAGVRLVDQGAAHRYEYSIPELVPGATVAMHHPVTPLQRGRYSWEPIRVFSAYPFGLYRRSLTFPAQESSTIVLPMLGTLDALQFRRWLRSSQRIANTLTREQARRSPAPADFYGVREYRPGDSPRWIHWRTTARLGEPMVREFEEPPQHHLLLVVEAWLPQPELELRQEWRKARLENLQTIRQLSKRLGPLIPEQKTAREQQLEKKERPYRAPLDHLELAISLAATLCWTWTRRLGASISLLVADDLANPVEVLESGPALRTALPLLERLAIAKATTSPQVPPLTRALAHHRIPKGPVVVISPRASTLAAQLAQSLGRPVQLMDVTQSTIRRFFSTPAKAILVSG